MRTKPFDTNEHFEFLNKFRIMWNCQVRRIRNQTRIAIDPFFANLESRFWFEIGRVRIELDDLNYLKIGRHYFSSET